MFQYAVLLGRSNALPRPRYIRFFLGQAISSVRNYSGPRIVFRLVVQADRHDLKSTKQFLSCFHLPVTIFGRGLLHAFEGRTS